MQTGVRPLRLKKSKVNLYALLIVPYVYFLIAFVYRSLVPGGENVEIHGELISSKYIYTPYSKPKFPNL